MNHNNLFCSNCGEPVNQEDRFCGACGFPVSDVTPQDTVPATPEPPEYPEIPIPDKSAKKRSPFRIVFYIIGTLVLCLSAFIISINMGLYSIDIINDDKFDAFINDVKGLWGGSDTISEGGEQKGEMLNQITCRLFVKTEPESASIRILNINPKFHQGIRLKPGNYHLEISAEGYITKKKWVVVEEGIEKHIEVLLDQYRIPDYSIIKSESSYSNEAEKATEEEDWKKLKWIVDEGLIYYPKSADLWSSRSSYYFHSTNEPFEVRQLEALEAAEHAYELDPSGVYASNVGWIHISMWKHFHSALPYLKEAENLNLQEEKPELYYWIGICYDQIGYIDEASDYYNLFLDVAPFHALADKANNRLDELFY